ncbi:type II secretion system minor pseudopilin GspK [Castellaniella hirudinis]|uniref:type II secretion system minor pseudopilin GspK n=1 Tax=Castellaniella hirudinis TaxID=1144617 RepID=UPI0039C37352
MTARPHAQRGVAIIAALLVVVVAAALATALVDRQGQWLARLQTERNLLQGQWLLQGGLDWSGLILRMDARDNATTRLDGLWTQTLADFPVGPPEDPRRALFSGQIEDMQGRFNLRDLAQDGQIRPVAVEALQGLLRSLGQDPAAAALIAQRVAEGQPMAGRAPRALGLRDVADLAAVAGLPAGLPGVLDPYVALVPATVSININTAPAEVLAAAIQGLGLAGGRDLVAQRERGQWFIHRGDMLNRLSQVPPAALRRLDVRSDWFRVTGEVALDDTMVALQALLHRDKQGRAVIRWVRYE